MGDISWRSPFVCLRSWEVDFLRVGGNPVEPGGRPDLGLSLVERQRSVADLFDWVSAVLRGVILGV